VTDLRIAHTADLDAATLSAARALMDVAFAGDFDDHDWEHALGGMHALLWEAEQLVAHASVVQRRLLHAGRALRTGYVEAVAVHPDRQRRGYGAAVMAPVERIVRGGYDVGALGATDAGEPFYVARGWQRWEGPTAALTPDGIVRTADADGGVYVFPVELTLDLDARLVADWRDGDVW
jgi:aminoglycoside 2'-N-acetyltransferase I